ncbi:cob(I)yrinic acid a,c-diamide adenosyltransferase [Streptomyces sp. SHP22-7]|nr:cob(I)yrinic acid a,c-diamide adenosyltransferase [Streptomyces sp. SHP22-7]
MPKGQPSVVPDDGLTTRQRRNRPLVVVHTGIGKGKSTAAFGLALRAWNQGWPIGVFQFVKSAKWKVGEENALRVLGASGEGGSVDWHKMGEGWSWVQRDAQMDNEEKAREGWEQVKRDLAAETYRLYVLDEFAYPMHWGWVDTDEVVSVLRERPGTQHVVITGRNAPEKLVEFADLVTDMSKVKHPMDAGRRGRGASSGDLRRSRLVIAAPSSGSGKTTVATGLMAALAARGLAVSPHKVGPDYIDPGYHALATGRVGRNLDAYLCGTELVAPLFLNGARGCDIAVVEGVMGLYDGAAGEGELASTAQVAKLLGRRWCWSWTPRRRRGRWRRWCTGSCPGTRRCGSGRDPQQGRVGPARGAPAGGDGLRRGAGAGGVAAGAAGLDAVAASGAGAGRGAGDGGGRGGRGDGRAGRRRV